jgi:hypothetical protein
MIKNDGKPFENARIRQAFVKAALIASEIGGRRIFIG